MIHRPASDDICIEELNYTASPCRWSANVWFLSSCENVRACVIVSGWAFVFHVHFFCRCFVYMYTSVISAYKQ